MKAIQIVDPRATWVWGNYYTGRCEPNVAVAMPRIPSLMGNPRPDQMQGTPLERLAELAGRVCYDSLGRGRSSAEYHQHIIEVGHLSVYEHCVFTVCIPRVDNDGWVHAMMNRPGLFAAKYERDVWRLTLNLRTVLEWDRMTEELGSPKFAAKALGCVLRLLAHRLAPQVVPGDFPERGMAELLLTTEGITEAEARKPHEKWATLHLLCSRGCSHELVRHGDFTAISQRSTRYVDESDEPRVVKHPLVRDLIRDLNPGEPYPTDAARAFLAYSNDYARQVDLGCDNKTARGIARRHLPHELATEIIFSASVAQWQRIFKQRVSPHAEAEINDLMVQAKLIIRPNGIGVPL